MRFVGSLPSFFSSFLSPLFIFSPAPLKFIFPPGAPPPGHHSFFHCCIIYTFESYIIIIRKYEYTTNAKYYQIKYIFRKVREVLGEIPILVFINDVNYTSSGTMELLFNKVKWVPPSIYLSICGVGVLPSKRPGFYNE